MDGLLHLALEPVLLSLQDFGVVHGDTVSGVITVVPHPCGLVQFTVFFESDPERPLGLAYVRVAAVDVTRRVLARPKL